MNRTGLSIALAVAAFVGTLFAIIPELDVKLVAPFWGGEFGLWATARVRWADRLRDVAAWLIALMVAPAIIAFVLKLLLPRRPMLMSGRAIILLVSTLALAPGLIANIILKDNWHRPRPFHLANFGGPAQFVPWWDPRGSCDTNCSFIGGEPSGAFWTMAPAALAPAPWRVAAYGAAIGFGTALGVLRMSAGGHFFTDVVFAGVFTFLAIWLVHGLLYRWRHTRVSDAAIERSLERITMPIYAVFMRMAARIRGPAPRN